MSTETSAKIELMLKALDWAEAGSWVELGKDFLTIGVLAHMEGEGLIRFNLEGRGWRFGLNSATPDEFATERQQLRAELEALALARGQTIASDVRERRYVEEALF